MKPRPAVRPRIEPLTHRGADREVYERNREVTAQIGEALSLQRPALTGRVEIERHTELGYLKEECVVYLIRQFQRGGDDQLVSHLMNCLATRIARRVHSQLSRSLHWSLVQDCSQEVLLEVARRVIDLTSDKDDFAQRSFGLWLKRITFNTMRPYLTFQKQERLAEVETGEFESPNGKGNQLKDERPGPDDLIEEAELRDLREDKANKLLEKLDPNVREAYLLRHREGLEIENRDPQVVTISKHFGRSPRTIRKWLAGAEERLQELQGDQP